jgi:hypothetical protein
MKNLKELKEFIVNLLNEEIKWCQNNSNENADFNKGFIDGLKQAIWLINITKFDAFEKADNEHQGFIRCPNCNGVGDVPDPGSTGGIECEMCEGTGRVPMENEIIELLRKLTGIRKAIVHMGRINEFLHEYPDVKEKINDLLKIEK